MYQLLTSRRAASFVLPLEDYWIFLGEHEKLRPTGILIRRPSCLEITARTSATIYFNRPLQALTRDVFIRADITFSALETSIYLFNGLHKFTNLLLLTYLLTRTSSWQTAIIPARQCARLAYQQKWKRCSEWLQPAVSLWS